MQEGHNSLLQHSPISSHTQTIAEAFEIERSLITCLMFIIILLSIHTYNLTTDMAILSYNVEC